jgi:hypothetical protein
MNEEGKFVDKKPVTSTTHIDDLTSNLSDENSNFKKAFRIIPFSTMEKSGGSTEVKLSSPGDIAGCIAAAKKFLNLDNSIILGWCNQDIEILTNSNKGSFNKDYKPDNAGKFPFAIGGGVGDKANLPLLFETYLGKYFEFLTSVWDEDVQKIVTDCSPNPKSADSTASSTSTPPAKSASSKPLDQVIKELIVGIKAVEDNEATLLALGIKKPSGGLVYKYPPSGDESLQEDKNLNSAAPTIDVMIKGFESAVTGDDTNFYLGACRSIQAAYKLEFDAITGDENSDEVKAAKMRAKLLLNLRKNSLLLKVPRRWDYATMQPGKVEEPPTELPGLMGYSLQKTIEYYSQVGGDEGNRFDELKIVKEPTPAIVDGNSITGIDGRFVKGIENVLGHSCYFSSVNQLLFTNEDFLQFLIISICKPIEESSYTLTTDINRSPGCNIDDTKKLIVLLKLYFNQWITNDNSSLKKYN